MKHPSLTVLIGLLLATAGCAPVQTYPYEAVGAAPAPAMSVAAADREAFEAWTFDRIRQVRDLLDTGAQPSDPQLAALAAELEEHAVDWKTFLVKTDDAFKFPMMAYANHSWFQLRQAADLERTARRLSGVPGESPHLLADGSVAHSAFFTRTDIDSYTPDRMDSEFAEITPAGRIKITREKNDGTSEGFFGEDERGREYIFIFDAPFNPEMQTSAEHIGSTLVRILGWRVPRTAVCTVQGTGNERYDGRRACATLAVRNYSGGWTYRSYRDRREVRALATVAAWLNNVDQTEHNTGISRQADGVYAYYVWDYGASLGSFTFRPKWPRLGWQHLFDPVRRHTARIRGTQWEQDWQVQSAAVGYFTDDFDPDRWVPFYPNLGLEEATEADKRWAAERIAQIRDAQIRAVVASAAYTHASDAEHVAATLIARRDRIAARYLVESAP